VVHIVAPSILLWEMLTSAPGTLFKTFKM